MTGLLATTEYGNGWVSRRKSISSPTQLPLLRIPSWYYAASFASNPFLKMSESFFDGILKELVDGDP